MNVRSHLEARWSILIQQAIISSTIRKKSQWDRIHHKQIIVLTIFGTLDSNWIWVCHQEITSKAIQRSQGGSRMLNYTKIR